MKCTAKSKSKTVVCVEARSKLKLVLFILTFGLGEGVLDMFECVPKRWCASNS